MFLYEILLYFDERAEAKNMEGEEIPRGKGK